MKEVRDPMNKVGAPMSDVVTADPRDRALNDIITLAKAHSLTITDITRALEAGHVETRLPRANAVMTRVFSIIGGLFVFAGFGLFAAMNWDDLGFSGHLALTLGVGFSAFIFAVNAVRQQRFVHAATPMFLLAALLQPAGIMLTIDHYSRGGDPAYAVLFMALVMLVQQGLTFAALNRTVLGFTALLFGLVFTVTGFDLMEVDYQQYDLVIGASLCLIGWAAGHSRHAALAGVCYFMGSGVLLWVAYDILERKPYEILYLGLACGMTYLAVMAKSRIMLANACIATMCYITYYTWDHFKDVNAWPLAVIFVGLLLIGIGALFNRVNTKYISHKD